MTTCNRADFARLLGRHPSHITRLAAADRLVFATPDLIDVEASVARIEATRGNRYDVELRWDEVRGQVQPPVQPAQAPLAEAQAAPPAPGQAVAEGDAIAPDEIGRRTRHAQMLKAEAEARGKEREDLLAAGALVPRAEVRRDLVEAVGIILNAAETLPDRLAPILVDQSDQGTVGAILRDEVEQFLAIVSERLGALAEQGSAA